MVILRSGVCDSVMGHAPYNGGRRIFYIIWTCTLYQLVATWQVFPFLVS
jgi:hypothetical protein